MSRLWERLVHHAAVAGLAVFGRAYLRRRKCVRLGSAYGGWWIPEDYLQPGGVVFAAGLGLDASFDLALIERYDCTVVALDPTPAVLEWVASRAWPEKFSLEPVGLAKAPGTVHFFAPRDASHVSHSLTNLQGTTGGFQAHVESFTTLRQRLGYEVVDLLKLDIEGAEHEVIESLTAALAPGVLCVEFDMPDSFRKVAVSLRRLLELGYRPVKTEGLNVTLIRD